MKITKQQLKQIIKEEFEFTMTEANMRDLPSVMNMLRGSTKKIQYTLLNRMPTNSE